MAQSTTDIDLKNRSRRAYRALREANAARTELASIRYDGVPEQIAAEARAHESEFREAHARIAGTAYNAGLTVHTGEEQAAIHAPTNPEDVEAARQQAIALRNCGLTAISRLSTAVNRHHIEMESNAYDQIRAAATRMIGNAESVRDALSETYTREARADLNAP